MDHLLTQKQKSLITNAQHIYFPKHHLHVLFHSIALNIGIPTPHDEQQYQLGLNEHIK